MDVSRRSFFRRTFGGALLGYCAAWPTLAHYLAITSPPVRRLDSDALLAAVTISGPFDVAAYKGSITKGILVVDVQRHDGRWEHAFVGGDVMHNEHESPRLTAATQENLRRSIIQTCTEACDHGYRELNGRRIPFKAIRMFNGKADANA